MSERGRIVIPKSIRQNLLLRSGEKLMVTIENGGNRISSVNSALYKAQNLVRQHCKSKSVVDDFIKSRRTESVQEVTGDNQLKRYKK